jgi:hypothetical protein
MSLPCTFANRRLCFAELKNLTSRAPAAAGQEGERHLREMGEGRPGPRGGQGMSELLIADGRTWEAAVVCGGWRCVDGETHGRGSWRGPWMRGGA